MLRKEVSGHRQGGLVQGSCGSWRLPACPAKGFRSRFHFAGECGGVWEGAGGRLPVCRRGLEGAGEGSLPSEPSHSTDGQQVQRTCRLSGDSVRHLRVLPLSSEAGRQTRADQLLSGLS